MAEVQIKCPNSGLWAWVGIVVDVPGWYAMQSTVRSSTCGVCGDTHTWSKSAARLVERDGYSMGAILAPEGNGGAQVASAEGAT